MTHASDVVIGRTHTQSMDLDALRYSINETMRFCCFAVVAIRMTHASVSMLSPPLRGVELTPLGPIPLSFVSASVAVVICSVCTCSAFRRMSEERFVYFRLGVSLYGP